MGHRGAPGRLRSCLSLQGNGLQMLGKKGQICHLPSHGYIYWYQKFGPNSYLLAFSDPEASWPPEQRGGGQYLPAFPAATHQKKKGVMRDVPITMDFLTTTKAGCCINQNHGGPNSLPVYACSNSWVKIAWELKVTVFFSGWRTPLKAVTDKSLPEASSFVNQISS